MAVPICILIWSSIMKVSWYLLDIRSAVNSIIQFDTVWYSMKLDNSYCQHNDTTASEKSLRPPECHPNLKLVINFRFVATTWKPQVDSLFDKQSLYHVRIREMSIWSGVCLSAIFCRHSLSLSLLLFKTTKSRALPKLSISMTCLSCERVVFAFIFQFRI